MIERGEDLEKMETLGVVEERFRRIHGLVEISIEVFEETMKDCRFYDSLKAYMNIEHFLQEGKVSALQLMNLDREKGNNALDAIEATEKKAYATSQNLAKNCMCKTQSEQQQKY